MATEWFYWSGGRQQGPFDEGHLKQLAEGGTLRPEELIWNASMTDWRPAGEVTDWRFGPAPQATVATVGPPAQTLAYVAQSDEPLVLSPRVIDLLARTAPWVRFLGVLTYILVAFFALLGVVMIFLTTGRAMPGAPGAVLGAAYILFAVIYIFIASYLNSYASRIGRLRRMKRTIDLEEALDVQRAFWKFCGVMTIVGITLYLGGIVIAVAFRLLGP
jgi:hypothetical protein